jgi:oligo-1,6-glucosidase
MYLGSGPLGKFDPIPYDWKDIKLLFKQWDSAMGDSGWISIFLDNHDFPRLVSRFGNDKAYRVESAKLLATLILTQRGTPCIYQGSELGMTNVAFSEIEDYKDVESINFYHEFTKAGTSKADFLALIHKYGRDNVRTPMQWNDNEHGGFSENESWIKVNPNYPEINAACAIENKESIFYFYQKLLNYRKANKTLVYGEIKYEYMDSIELFAYSRKDANGEFYIILNHSDKVQQIEKDLTAYTLEIQNMNNSNANELEPWEARIYKRK